MRNVLFRHERYRLRSTRDWCPSPACSPPHAGFLLRLVRVEPIPALDRVCIADHRQTIRIAENKGKVRDSYARASPDDGLRRRDLAKQTSFRDHRGPHGAAAREVRGGITRRFAP